MKRHVGAALGALLLLGAAPAHAQSQEIVADMAGPYQIVPTDGTPACGIQLTAERMGEAWRARPDPSCAARVRASAPVVAWRPMDGILLLDARGRAAMTFVEDETALPSSPDLQAPKYYLVPRIAGYTRLPRPAELAGQWTLRSPGRAPCPLTLKDTPQRTIVLGKGCAGKPLPARFTHWSFEDMQIMLWGPGDILLALGPAADNRYVAEGGWALSR